MAGAHCACSCCSIQGAHAPALAQVEALQQALLPRSRKQAMPRGHGAGVDSWRLRGQRRVEASLRQIQPACHSRRLTSLDMLP